MMNPDKRRDEILAEFMELVADGLVRLVLNTGILDYRIQSGRLRELIQQYHDDVIDPKRGEVEDGRGPETEE